MSSIILKPGVNLEYTPSLNEAGISQSQLVRVRQGLTEKLGGWESFNGVVAPSTARDVHPWGGIASGRTYFGIGGTNSLTVYRSDVGALQDLTPHTSTRNFTPNFSVSSGSNIVTIVEPSSANTYQSIFFNTQVAVGTLLLQGGYHINTVGGSSIYTILASANSDTTVVSSGILPVFTTVANSAIVTVTLPNHGYTATPGLYQQFIAPTTVSTNSAGSLIIQGPYEINSVIDSTSFKIALTQQASAAITVTMNSSLAQIVYYRTQGPLPTGSGFGFGGFGSGGFGSGSTTSVSTSALGVPITADEWTMDNWGSVLLAAPEDGPIYQWNPSNALTTMDVVPTAPFFNGGIFVAMPQQILVAWRSTQTSGTQSPLEVRWSDQGDFTNWNISDLTAAGSFTIPTGSKIIGGIQAPTQAVISTDIDVWAMQYVGGNIIFNFNRIGSGCAWIGPHAAGIQSGNLFWCSNNGFYMLSRGGVQDIPCPVWDFLFQNLNRDQEAKIQAAPNAMFNEISWYFPSLNATECDSYVKLNTADGSWDFGTLDRTAWTDASLVGNAIGVDTLGNVWEHEQGRDNGTTPMTSFFQSGYWRIQEGNELAFVDLIIPDMKFAVYSSLASGTPVSGGATVQITFFVVDYLGDAPNVYGPYIFTNATEFINTRIRGRFMAVRIESADSGSFWRIGRINYRWAPAGRR